jgi:hypothetical protein
VLAAVVLSLALLASGAVPSRAAEAGWWASDDPGVQSAWAAGIDGSGVTIAVIDTAPIVDNPVLEGADVSYRQAVVTDADTKEPVQCYDAAGQPVGTSMTAGTVVHDAQEDKGSARYASHGTLMLGAVVGNGTWYDGQTGVRGVAPKTSVNFYTFGTEPVTAGGSFAICYAKNDRSQSASKRTFDTISRAVDDGARVISMSFGGSFISTGDLPKMVKALRHGVIMVEGRSNDLEQGLKARVGNPGDLTGFPGSVLVNSIGQGGSIAPTSDTVDASVSILSPGNDVPMPLNYSMKDIETNNGGTSTATANLSGYLALIMQKWPDATGNQILQSLVRNTKENKGEMLFDESLKEGFGRVDVGAMLQRDPARYPDVNPILEMQVNTAAKTDWAKDWYTQDCESNSYGLDSKTEGGYGTIHVPCEANLLKVELERQQSAWKKVKECQEAKKGDCMSLSATNMALAEDGAKSADESGGVTTDSGSPSASGVPVWVWWCAGGVAAAVVIGGIVLALVLSRRRRTAARPRAGNGPSYPPAGGYGAGPSPVRGFDPMPYGGYPTQGGVPGGASAYPARPGVRDGANTYPPQRGNDPHAYAPPRQPVPQVPMPPQPQAQPRSQQAPQSQPYAGRVDQSDVGRGDGHGRHVR